MSNPVPKAFCMYASLPSSESVSCQCHLSGRRAAVFNMSEAINLSLSSAPFVSLRHRRRKEKPDLGTNKSRLPQCVGAVTTTKTIGAYLRCNIRSTPDQGSNDTERVSARIPRPSAIIKYSQATLQPSSRCFAVKLFHKCHTCMGNFPDPYSRIYEHDPEDVSSEKASWDPGSGQVHPQKTGKTYT